MAPAGFKPAIPESELPYTLTLDRSATGIAWRMISSVTRPLGRHYKVRCIAESIELPEWLALLIRISNDLAR